MSFRIMALRVCSAWTSSGGSISRCACRISESALRRWNWSSRLRSIGKEVALEHERGD